MHIRRKPIIHYFLLIILFTIGQTGLSQDTAESIFNADRTYTVEELQEDFRLLRTALEEGHAGLYFYSSKEQMDSLFDSVAAELDHPMTEFEFYRHLAYLIAGINDGHTRIMFSTEYDRYLSREPIMIPFNLKFIGPRAYLYRNYSPDENFILGGEVLAINDIPLKDIIGKILPCIPSDGRIISSKYKKMSSTSTFSKYFSLLFERTTTFTIDYRSPEDGQDKSLKIEGITEREMNKIYYDRYPEAAKGKPPIEVEYRENSAVLTIRTFSNQPYSLLGLAFPTFIEEVFHTLEEKEMEHLIIDLRDNGGGADMNGKLLFSYLIDKPYMYYHYLEMNRNEFSFLDLTDSPEAGEMIKARTRKNSRGKYNAQFHPNLGEQKPEEPGFKGDVYVLIDGGSFSASGETTSLMHFHKRAVFIGEECGAGYYGNTSGLMPTLTLPHTELRIRIPMLRYVMAVSGYKYPDRGIIPDYPFQRTIEDYLNNRDTEMEYVFEMIKKSN